ncbi:hypothetical protein [Bifidobacterium pullorum]|uniref:hypothetical protein n=1 Tax=Bifidobacterium pullorum TaxID=78448 RepID=UPI00389026E2
MKSFDAEAGGREDVTGKGTAGTRGTSAGHMEIGIASLDIAHRRMHCVTRNRGVRHPAFHQALERDSYVGLGRFGMAGRHSDDWNIMRGNYCTRLYNDLWQYGPTGTALLPHISDTKRFVAPDFPRFRHGASTVPQTTQSSSAKNQRPLRLHRLACHMRVLFDSGDAGIRFAAA